MKKGYFWRRRSHIADVMCNTIYDLNDHDGYSTNISGDNFSYYCSEVKVPIIGFAIQIFKSLQLLLKLICTTEVNNRVVFFHVKRYRKTRFEVIKYQKLRVNPFYMTDKS